MSGSGAVATAELPQWPQNFIPSELSPPQLVQTQVVPEPAERTLGKPARERAFDFAWSTIEEHYYDATFHGVDWNHRSTSIGYWLAEDRQGRGTMTEAVRALTTHAFDVWRLNRVEIRVAVGNVRSAAVPRRLGFTEEGVLRQAERHGRSFKDIREFKQLLLDREERTVARNLVAQLATYATGAPVGVPVAAILYMGSPYSSSSDIAIPMLARASGGQAISIRS